MNQQKRLNEVEAAVREELYNRFGSNEDLEDQVTWDAALIVWKENPTGTKWPHGKSPGEPSSLARGIAEELGLLFPRIKPKNNQAKTPAKTRGSQTNPFNVALQQHPWRQVENISGQQALLHRQRTRIRHLQQAALTERPLNQNHETTAKIFAIPDHLEGYCGIAVRYVEETDLYTRKHNVDGVGKIQFPARTYVDGKKKYVITCHDSCVVVDAMHGAKGGDGDGPNGDMKGLKIEAGDQLEVERMLGDGWYLARHSDGNGDWGSIRVSRLEIEERDAADKIVGPLPETNFIVGDLIRKEKGAISGASPTSRPKLQAGPLNLPEKLLTNRLRPESPSFLPSNVRTAGALRPDSAPFTPKTSDPARLPATNTERAKAQVPETEVTILQSKIQVLENEIATLKEGEALSKQRLDALETQVEELTKVLRVCAERVLKSGFSPRKSHLDEDNEGNLQDDHLRDMLELVALDSPDDGTRETLNAGDTLETVSSFDDGTTTASAEGVRADLPRNSVTLSSSAESQVSLLIPELLTDLATEELEGGRIGEARPSDEGTMAALDGDDAEDVGSEADLIQF